MPSACPNSCADDAFIFMKGHSHAVCLGCSQKRHNRLELGLFARHDRFIGETSLGRVAANVVLEQPEP